MPGKAAKVVITERQQVILEELSRSRNVAQVIAQRATIILRAFGGRLSQEIAEEVGLERKQVGLWRRRWRDAWESLTVLECTEPRRLREAVRETLRDAQRSGAPATFTVDQVAQILAVACESPAQSRRPITHWTLRELRDEAIQRGIVPSISESRVGHFLRGPWLWGQWNPDVRIMSLLLGFGEFTDGHSTPGRCPEPVSDVISAYSAARVRSRIFENSGTVASAGMRTDPEQAAQLPVPCNSARSQARP